MTDWDADEMFRYGNATECCPACKESLSGMCKFHREREEQKLEAEFAAEIDVAAPGEPGDPRLNEEILNDSIMAACPECRKSWTGTCTWHFDHSNSAQTPGGPLTPAPDTSKPPEASQIDAQRRNGTIGDWLFDQVVAITKVYQDGIRAGLEPSFSVADLIRVDRAIRADRNRGASDFDMEVQAEADAILSYRKGRGKS